MRRSDVQFKAKADTALFDETPVVAKDVDIIPPGWLELPPLPEPNIHDTTMPAYPYNGQAVWLTPNGVDMQAAQWRITRSYNPLRVQWVYEAYWARHNSGGQRIDFTPVGYRNKED